jgi:signal transduction histidine kinase
MATSTSPDTAHELNQPITAAITNANTCLRWLRERPDLQEAREATMRVVRYGTRAAEIIKRLTSFYKEGAPSQRELMDINKVVPEMIGLLQNETSRHSVTIRTDLAPEMPRVMAEVSLPTAETEDIFKAFFTSKPRGAGMGLAITRSLIEAHGGRLWTTPDAHRGTTFHFTLPREQGAYA